MTETIQFTQTTDTFSSKIPLISTNNSSYHLNALNYPLNPPFPSCPQHPPVRPMGPSNSINYQNYSNSEGLNRSSTYDSSFRTSYPPIEFFPTYPESTIHSSSQPSQFSNQVISRNSEQFSLKGDSTAVADILQHPDKCHYFFAEFSYYTLRTLIPHRRILDGSSLNQFCHNFIRSINPTLPTLFSSLVYIERVRAKNPEWVAKQSQNQLFAASMMLASKYIDDVPLPNTRWAMFGNFDSKTLNSLELEFFDVSGYMIDFDTKLFNRWIITLERFLQAQSRRMPMYYTPTPPALSEPGHSVFMPFTLPRHVAAPLVAYGQHPNLQYSYNSSTPQYIRYISQPLSVAPRLISHQPYTYAIA